MVTIMPYLISTFTMIGIYCLFALGLNLQWGFAGLINFGHIAFAAVGAYTAVILNLHGIPLFLAVLTGLILSGAVGALLTLPAIRLKADYLAILTLGFSEIIRYFLVNEIWLTGGPSGLTGFSLPFRGIIPAENYNLFFLGLIFFLVAFSFILLQILVKSPWGRVLKSIREDEKVTKVVGKNVTYYKMQAFVLGSILAGLAGIMLAFYHSFISPDYYYPLETFYAWIIIIVGGSANNWGTLLGSIFLWAFLNGTRFLTPLVPLPAFTFSALRMALIGFLLVLMILYRPQGVLGDKKELTF